MAGARPRDRSATQTGDRSDAFVFFGATGDLAYKQIFPALADLIRENFGVKITYVTPLQDMGTAGAVKAAEKYLDERFPHPPLHQMDPVSRANARMLIKRIDQDWYQLLDEILFSGEKKSARAKKMLRESLLSAAPIFAARPYFMSDEFSLIDCVIAPLLWRLPSIGIDVSTPNEVITNYAQRLFKRPAFKRSLSEAEKEMAEPLK